jgi:hypothetical protein
LRPASTRKLLERAFDLFVITGQEKLHRIAMPVEEDPI